MLCTQCRGVGPHLTARGNSHGFSRVAAGTWSVFLCYAGDGPSKLVFVQRCHDSCLVTRDTSGISTRLGWAIQTLLELRRETDGPFRVATVIFGFLSIFRKGQALSPFEALNSACLSRCQRDVRPPVQMRRGTRAFSSVSPGVSDIPSSYEMKDEPAFKPLQGNPAFFRVRASRCPLHLRQKSKGPSHIPITEGSLLLRRLWIVGLPLQLKPGNQLSSRDDMGSRELSSSSCAEIVVSVDLRQVSQGISGVALGKSSHLLCVMWNAGWLWCQCRGIRLQLELIWCTLIYFAFLQ